MKKIIYILCFSSLFSNIFPQYSIDTLSSVYVGPGVKHTKILVPEIPWAVNILEIDRTNPYIQFETVKANDKLAGLERVSSMASRKDHEGHFVVGAINGDFYGGGGVPTNTQVLKGEVLKAPINREIVGFDFNNKPFIETVEFSGSVIFGDTSISISDINSPRGTDELILYNQYMGSGTGTNQYGTEVRINAIDPWLVNDTVRAVVESKVEGSGDQQIQGKAVLSGHGISRDFLNKLNIGDTVKIINKLLPGLLKMKEGVGGSERIIHNGVNVGGWFERHPRTAVGFSKDSSKVYFIVVDGRTTISAGMQLDEFGEFLLKIGNIHEALNLDGGGSTTMLVRGNIENYPSDGPGTERSVSNGIMIITTAPKGAPKGVNILPKVKRIFRADQANFQAKGYDEFYNPFSLEPAQVEFSADSNIGTIRNDGVFTAGNVPDTGYIHLKYGNFTDSALIVVKDLVTFSLHPENIMTDTTRAVYFGTIGYDIDNYKYALEPDQFDWTTDNPEIGVMDSLGYFHGKKQGIVKVIARYGNLADTSIVKVEIGSGIVQLDALESDTAWVISGSEVDLNSTTLSLDNTFSSAGEGSFKLDYKFTAETGKLNYLYLDPKEEIPIFGIPEFIYIDAKSDSLKHRLFYILSDDNAELFRVNANRYLDRKYSFDTIPCPMKTFAPVEGKPNFYFPVKLKRIEIQLAGVKTAGTVNTGTIYLDNLRIKYPASEPTVVELENDRPSEFMLSQNYPNPFNPVTVINYQLPIKARVQLKVYDILGNEAAILVNEEKFAGSHSVKWNASNMASGIYFYRLQAQNYVQTRKMILVK